MDTGITHAKVTPPVGMNNTSKFLFLIALFAFGTVSCATVGKVGKGSVDFVKNTSAAAVERINPADVKVVEVREKDLKELPTGQERALAFQNRQQPSRKTRFWALTPGPVDFDAPLPEIGVQTDGGLLPPRAP